MADVKAPPIKSEPEPVNRERGEVALVVGEPGALQTYVLVLNTNALCRLEEMTRMKIQEITPRLTNPGLGDLRVLLAAALSERHPAMSIRDAGDLVTRAGYEAAFSAVVDAFNLGFPAARGGERKAASPPAELAAALVSASARRKGRSNRTNDDKA